MSTGPQQRETDKSVSSSTASWGWGPNKEKLVNQFLQAMQVGVGLRNLSIQIRFLSRSLLKRR
ncbi:hypothetical protein [Staphylococcus marylandisciuri]|uniref:hypothetical protein n=1 Tax=Staphylococcus marylandisciuri TaxID=2981529 RepID=UPI0021D27A66|nr:hypothetical protein [Staphylococcus marylandisciuri]